MWKSVGSVLRDWCKSKINLICHKHATRWLQNDDKIRRHSCLLSSVRQKSTPTNNNRKQFEICNCVDSTWSTSIFSLSLDALLCLYLCHHQHDWWTCHFLNATKSNFLFRVSIVSCFSVWFLTRKPGNSLSNTAARLPLICSCVY